MIGVVRVYVGWYLLDELFAEIKPALLLPLRYQAYGSICGLLLSNTIFHCKPIDRYIAEIGPLDCRDAP